MNNIDYEIFYFLNSFAGKSNLTDWVIIFFARHLVYVFVAAVIIYLLINRRKILAYTAVTHAFLSFVIARLIITELIRFIWHRPRPFLAQEVTELFNKGNEASFPSGHAAAMFAIAAAIYFYNKSLGMWLFVAAIVTTVSRVISGVHYPSDILAGAVVGVLVAWLFMKRIDIIKKVIAEFSRLLRK